MKTEKIHSILLSVRYGWREVFYLRVCRNGQIILRASDFEPDIQGMHQCRLGTILFERLLQTVADTGLSKNIDTKFYSHISLSPEITFIFSGENIFNGESLCIDFTAHEESIGRHVQHKLLAELKKAADEVRKEITDFHSSRPASSSKHTHPRPDPGSVPSSKSTGRQLNSWFPRIMKRK